MENDTMMEKNKFIVEENLPAYKKDDIKININKKKRTLEINAQKSTVEEDEEIEEKGDLKICFYEKDARSFYKKVSIPENVNIEKVKTTFHKDGTLTIEFEK